MGEKTMFSDSPDSLSSFNMSKNDKLVTSNILESFSKSISDESYKDKIIQFRSSEIGSRLLGNVSTYLSSIGDKVNNLTFEYSKIFNVLDSEYSIDGKTPDEVKTELNKIPDAPSKPGIISNMFKIDNGAIELTNELIHPRNEKEQFEFFLITNGCKSKFSKYDDMVYKFFKTASVVANEAAKYPKNLITNTDKLVRFGGAFNKQYMTTGDYEIGTGPTMYNVLNNATSYIPSELVSKHGNKTLEILKSIHNNILTFVQKKTNNLHKFMYSMQETKNKSILKFFDIYRIDRNHFNYCKDLRYVLSGNNKDYAIIIPKVDEQTLEPLYRKYFGQEQVYDTADVITDMVNELETAFSIYHDDKALGKMFYKICNNEFGSILQDEDDSRNKTLEFMGLDKDNISGLLATKTDTPETYLQRLSSLQKDVQGFAKLAQPWIPLVAYVCTNLGAKVRVVGKNKITIDPDTLLSSPYESVKKYMNTEKGQRLLRLIIEDYVPEVNIEFGEIRKTRVARFPKVIARIKESNDGFRLDQFEGGFGLVTHITRLIDNMYTSLDALINSKTQSNHALSNMYKFSAEKIYRALYTIIYESICMNFHIITLSTICVLDNIGVEITTDFKTAFDFLKECTHIQGIYDKTLFRRIFDLSNAELRKTILKKLNINEKHFLETAQRQMSDEKKEYKKYVEKIKSPPETDDPDEYRKRSRRLIEESTGDREIPRYRDPENILSDTESSSDEELSTRGTPRGKPNIPSTRIPQDKPNIERTGVDFGYDKKFLEDIADNTVTKQLYGKLSTSERDYVKEFNDNNKELDGLVTLDELMIAEFDVHKLIADMMTAIAKTNDINDRTVDPTIEDLLRVFYTVVLRESAISRELRRVRMYFRGASQNVMDYIFTKRLSKLVELISKAFYEAQAMCLAVMYLFRYPSIWKDLPDFAKEFIDKDKLIINKNEIAKPIGIDEDTIMYLIRYITSYMISKKTDDLRSTAVMFLSSIKVNQDTVFNPTLLQKGKFDISVINDESNTESTNKAEQNKAEQNKEKIE